jgi:hypothetical protein
MAPAGFELTIPTRKRLQTHSLDRSTTGIGAYKALETLTGMHVCAYCKVMGEWKYTLQPSSTPTLDYISD